jgi:hypothetical protein
MSSPLSGNSTIGPVPRTLGLAESEHVLENLGIEGQYPFVDAKKDALAAEDNISVFEVNDVVGLSIYLFWSFLGMRPH